ncbi:hypothetical protein MAR_037447, partial [Mya arenaria]
MTESMARPGFEFTFPGDSMQSPKPLSTVSPPLLPVNDGGGGPSWGLIIPIIMIGLFLLSVVLCLWWHKWRDKRQTLQISRSGNSAFSRSYRSRGPMDSIRDSTRSTTPLRSSLNEKTGSSSLNNMNRNSNFVK